VVSVQEIIKTLEFRIKFNDFYANLEIALPKVGEELLLLPHGRSFLTFLFSNLTRLKES
jgi:hypothetical protein